VYIIKLDISDGLYRIDVNPYDIPRLGIVFPTEDDQEPLIAFPLVLPMGWKNSPPAFTTATETIADLANCSLKAGLMVQPHQLDERATRFDKIEKSSGKPCAKPSQPHLIAQILKAWRLDGEKVKEKDTPAKSSVILNAGLGTKEFDESFNYRSIIGKLNYLERGTRSDISYIVHQCARFTACPKDQHAQAIRWLGRYLRATKDKGLRIKPKKGRMLKVYVDADFAGNFDKKESHLRDTARSRHGYIIMYEGVPITWKSQLQTEIALSSTKSEYTGLSYALREAIPIMHLLKEMKAMGFPITGARG
jgi:hypothetical protein